MFNLDDIINNLKVLGFSEKESKILVCLYNHHQLVSSAIARKTKINRTRVYQLLSGLQEKGVVKTLKQGGVTYYSPCDFDFFIELQQKANKSHSMAIQEIEQSIPELQNLFSGYAQAPQMSLFTGKEGLIQIMEDTLTSEGDILNWCNVDISEFSLLKDYYPDYIGKKTDSNLWVRGIFNIGSVGSKFQRSGVEELREAYLVPSSILPFSNEINIYNDKVSIIAHQDEIGVIIQNKHIADTQRSIFKLGFAMAKQIDKKGHAFYKENFKPEDFFPDLLEDLNT